MFKKIILLLTFWGLLYAPSFAKKQEPVNYETIKNFIDTDDSLSLRDYLAQYPYDLETILKTKITPKDFYFSYGKTEHFCQVPLHYAAATNKTKIVDLILELAPNKLESKDPYNKATPLWCAAYNGNLHLVKHLHEIGADLNVKDTLGYDPLLVTITRHHHRTFSYLLSKGVKLIYREGYSFDKITGDTSLMAFLSNVSDIYAENLKEQKKNEEWQYDEHKMFYALIQKHKEDGKDFNIPNTNGVTPLMRAVRKNDIYYVSALLNKKADIKARDNNGENACNYAMRYADKNIQNLVCISRKVANINSADIAKAENKIKDWFRGLSF